MRIVKPALLSDGGYRSRRRIGLELKIAFMCLKTRDLLAREHRKCQGAV